MIRQITPAQAVSLTLAAQGLTCKEAAQMIGMSPWTIKDHWHNACIRLGAKNTIHAVALAIKSGQISADDVDAA